MKYILALHLLLWSVFSPARTTDDKLHQAIRHRQALTKEQSFAQFSRNKRTMAQAMVPIYSTDFSNGIPSSWSNVDSAGHGRRWYFSNNECFRCNSIYSGSGIDSLSVQGTSSANGIAMYDSDSAGTSIGGDYGVLTTSAINCSGFGNVHLQFNELFIYCNDLPTPAYPNTARVYVSNDNVNYYLFHQAEYGLFNCGESTNNPNMVDIDISGIAANRSTVYVRFSFTGDYSYWWFIDDVTLLQPSPYDAAVTGIHPIFNGCSLGTSENVTIDLKNCGTQPISNFQVSYTINSGSPVTETVATPLQPNATMSYTFNQSANLSGASTYQLIASVNLANDAYSLNNRDTLNTLSIPPISPPYSNGFENPFDAEVMTFVDGNSDGIKPLRSSSSPRTGSYCLNIPASPQNQCDDWFFTSCLDLTSSTFRLDYWTKCFDLANAYQLDVYLCTSTSPSDTLFLLQHTATAIDTNYQSNTCFFAPPATGIYHLGFHWTGNGSNSQLHFDDLLLDFINTVNAASHENGLMIYPNPAGDRVNLQFNQPLNSNTPIFILDETGRIVFRKDYVHVKSINIDLGAIARGSYTVMVVTPEGNIRKKLIKSE